MPLYARAPSALHASSQSRTFVVPAVVQIVIEPSPLHVASVPEQGGKHVFSAGDVDDVRSAQLAADRASAHAPVTRMAVNCRRHVSIVMLCWHSSISLLQSFSELIGRRPPVPPDDDDDEEVDVPDPEPPEDELVLPVPGYGSQPVTATASAPATAPRRASERNRKSTIILATSTSGSLHGCGRL